MDSLQLRIVRRVNCITRDAKASRIVTLEKKMRKIVIKAISVIGASSMIMFAVVNPTRIVQMMDR